MKRFWVGCIGLMVLTLALSSAFAADSSPPYNWTGFYVGINGGGGWGDSRHDFEAAGTTTGDYRISGATAGGTLGANLQAGGLLLGVEGDMNWSDIGGSDSCPNPNFTCRTRNKWFATARGRVGDALDRFLPYITAGAAFGEIRANFRILEAQGKRKWVGPAARAWRREYSAGSVQNSNTCISISANLTAAFLAPAPGLMMLNSIHIFSVSA
jgi:opacity protein-like surface antigen